MDKERIKVSFTSRLDAKVDPHLQQVEVPLADGLKAILNLPQLM
ncbi:MAG: hypothetical protein ACI8W8_002147 [Rhodothermales bacterium]|jgi:hypothetical protein